MAGRRKSATRRLAAAAVLSALGVVLLTVGAFVDVLDLSMAAIASLTVVFAVIELGGKWPYLVYLVTAALSLLLLPNKSPALLYALFAGYYPILKAALEKHLKKPLAWLIKIVVFCGGLALSIFVAVRFFTVTENSLFSWYYWLVLVMAPIFVLYDIALTRLISAYLFRWRKRFHFLDD